MKKATITLGLVLAAAVSANAQGKAKKAMKPMLVAQNSSIAVPSAPTQTSTTSAAAAAPAPAKKWSGLVLFESWSNQGDIKKNEGSAAVDTTLSLGVMYKATPKLSVGARHKTQIRNRADNKLTDYQRDAYDPLEPVAGSNADQKLEDPTLHLNYSSDLKVAGSNPLSLATRYYVPVKKESVASKSMGVLRAQTNMEWDLNPKVSLNWLVQGRLYMNSSQHNLAGSNSSDRSKKLGADSTLRFITGPGITYNFSDKLNVYYSTYTDQRSVGFQRGNFSADTANYWFQEVGLNITAGPVTINPIYLSGAQGLNRAGYGDFGTDELSEVDLIISASF